PPCSDVPSSACCMNTFAQLTAYWRREYPLSRFHVPLPRDARAWYRDLTYFRPCYALLTPLRRHQKSVNARHRPAGGAGPGAAVEIVCRYLVENEVATHDVGLRVADHVYWRYLSRVG